MSPLRRLPCRDSGEACFRPWRPLLKGRGVTVNIVAPGYISTDSQLPFEADAAAAGPIGRSGTPTGED
jgi:NAD(P)-dependent dehydrogenase (short-subunit alcohol dehydrogenase family)